METGMEIGIGLAKGKDETINIVIRFSCKVQYWWDKIVVVSYDAEDNSYWALDASTSFLYVETDERKTFGAASLPRRAVAQKKGLAELRNNSAAVFAYTVDSA